MKFRLWWVMLVNLTLAQVRVGDWQNITSPLQIKAITALGDTLVCGTNGGLLLYNPNRQTFEVLTNLDGLAVTTINSVFKGPQNNLWLSGDGIIQVYDFKNHVSVNIFDFDLDEVIGFTVFKGVVYGVYRQETDWGIAEFIFSDNQYYYRDLYARPGLNLVTGLAVKGDSLYLATDSGLLAGNPHRTHITQWSNPYTNLGDTIRILSEKNGELAFVTGSKVYSLSSGDPEPVQLIDNSTINDLQALTIRDFHDYVAVSDSIVYQLTSDQIEPVLLSPGYRLTTVYLNSVGELFFGSGTGIVRDKNGLTHEAPDSPVIGSPTALAVLTDGSLVISSSKGIARRIDDSWENWIVDYRSSFGGGEKLKLNPFPYSLGTFVPILIEGPSGVLNGAITGSNPKQGGGGIITINSFSEPISVTLTDSSSIPYYVSPANDSTFQVQDLALDNHGNLWAVSINSRDEPLQVYAGGQWKSFSITQSDEILCRSVTSVAVDNFGRVWIGARGNDSLNVGLFRNGGLTMLKVGGDSDNPQAEKWIAEEIDFGSGPQSVWDLAVSPQNRLFVLTPAGLIYKDLQISTDNPVKITGPVSANGQLYPYFPNVVFTRGAGIRIDPRGNSWIISPREGIRILLANGEYWPDVNGLREKNSYLLSDNVRDLAFDGDKGLAYIATDRGVSVVKIPFAEKKKSFQQVSLFPSPYHIPSDRPLVVDGLKDHSAVMIMNLNGRVIRTLTEDSNSIHGYQAFWDGRNENGQWVNSGVYLVAIHDRKGAVVFEKITVIRH